MSSGVPLEARLEAIALVRCAHHRDERTASAIFYGAEDKGAVVGALAMLARHLMLDRHGDDLDRVLDDLSLHEVQTEVEVT